MNKKVSVIMSTYNESKEQLSMAIESILNQTFTEFQYVIVVDNPSNEDILSVVTEYANCDSRIEVLVNPHNCGIVYSLNRAISVSRGEYIARMDADDISYENRIEIEMDYLDNNPDIDIVSSQRVEIDDNNEILTLPEIDVIPDWKINDITKYGAAITQPTVMMRKSILDKLNGYREVTAAEDYDMWLRCCTSGYKFHIINQPLLKYRIRTNSLSRINYAKTWAHSQYARYLYHQRMKAGNDSFSEENKAAYIKSSVAGNPKRQEKFNLYYFKFMKGVKEFKSHRYFKGLCRILLSLICERELLKVLCIYCKFIITKKRAIKEGK